MDDGVLGGTFSMIKIVTKNRSLSKALMIKLKHEAVLCETMVLRSEADFEELYNQNIKAIVIDTTSPSAQSQHLTDVINSLSSRVPIIVMAASYKESDNSSEAKLLPHYFDTVTVLYQPTDIEVVATLGACGVIDNTIANEPGRSLPFYNSQIALRMLRSNGGISVLSIDAGSFRKIELEYGTDVYERVRAVFQSLLCELWGSTNFFRGVDVICRRALHSNTYYVFLNRSRHQGALPRPGVLEKIADRINRTLQNALWGEIVKRQHKRLPACIESIPMVSVGFATALDNPCLDAADVIEKVLENSIYSARTQHERMKNLQRELMHTLIQNDELLYPNFQAVFNLRNISKEMIDAVKMESSIEPLAGELYGFESLIRVRGDLVDNLIGSEHALISSEYLRPDVLFNMAKATKVSLELDQACLRAAAEYAASLPGRLFINILPRNLYFFDRLFPMFAGMTQITFEVSESEAISNFELMMQVREGLREKGIGIAADDFGKGFAGLERIIKIKPDIIKFDRSLIENIHQDPLKQAYVKGLVRAAKILQTTVLAEGVELWEEAVVLQEMEIDLVQGFLFHRPEQAARILDQVAGSAKLKIKSVA